MTDQTGAAAWLASLEAALNEGDGGAAAALFNEDCYWRDLIALTWNIVTVEGRAGIAAMLAASLPQARPIRLTPAEGPGSDETWLTFETAVARGRGHLRMRDGKGYTLLTAMRELKGFEERTGFTREQGTEHGARKNRVTWLDRREAERAALGVTTQPYCLIVGGGQGGIALAARMRRIGVPALVIDRHERPGDAWRKRYKSLCLHDPVWYDHMPYIPFPEHWPIYTPKDQIGDWLEMYTGIMELNWWGNTDCRRASFDAERQEWTVEVERDGRPMTLRPKHLVLATGMSGVPNMPDIPGMAGFRGKIHHSSAHPGGEAFAGRRAIVVGSNNSAHDIAADLWEHDADVTMIQRSSTLVVRQETLRAAGTRGGYTEQAARDGISTDTADLMTASMPYRLAPAHQVSVWDRIQRDDKPFYDRLRAAGFLLDFGEDGSGLSTKYLRRGSGYYIDVGASDLVADGRIALQSGTQVAEFTRDSVVLTNGAVLPADLVVFATGYGSMNGWAAKLISPEVADRVGKCWGLGSGTAYDPGPWEGELRNMWKPTKQTALWFQGGNLAQARHYSIYLALQIKARMEGISTPVYGLPEVHHLG